MRFRSIWAAAGLVLALLGGAAAATPSPNRTLQQAGDLIEWGRWKEARDLLAQAVAQPDPPGQQATEAAETAFYGHILVEFGDLARGLKLTKQALAMDEACAPCHLYRFEALAERAKGMSQFRALLQLPKLKKELQQAEALDPRLGDVQWAWIDFDLGLPAAVGGGSKDAYLRADKLAAIDPVDAWLARASIAAADKKPDQALADFRSAAAQDANDPRGTFALGQALYQRRAYTAAAAPLARAFLLNPRSALYSGYHAANLARLKKLDQARDVLATGHRQHPDSRLGDFLVAQALKDTGQDFSWAKQLLADYLAVPPEPEQPTADQARQLLASLG